MEAIFIRNTKRSTGTVRAGEYDFAKDAGVAGAFNSGVYIPALSVIKRFYVKVITAPVGATATIAFGITGSTQALMVTNGVAAFVINTVVPGVDFNANPLMLSTTFGAASQVLMTIGTANLTAGRIAFAVEFDEFDF